MLGKNYAHFNVKVYIAKHFGFYLMAKKSNRLIYIFLLLVYIIVSTVCSYSYGIKFVNDSPRYLNYALNLRQGFYIEPHNFWYFGYVLFIYVIKLFNQTYFAIIISQYVLGYLAVIAIYETGLILFNNRIRALLPALLYIGFFEIPAWNSYILSEPFYISFTCFSIYFSCCHLY